jgi:moderate conductance mechanosensitive channel
MALLLPATMCACFAPQAFFTKIFQDWSSDTQEFIHVRLPHLIVVAAIAFLLIQSLRVITRRMVRVAQRHAVSAERMAEVRTLAGVVRATGMAVIAVITGLQFLAALGIDLAPLLASAGVAGIAIGLAAQTIVKDVLNGMLILMEGQFNVGDTVKLAGVSGVVESMTLRKTTLRDGADGSLCVIPNSQITTVVNQSVGFSVATVNVSVDFSAHPDEITRLLRNVAMEVRDSKEFKAVFVADPQVLGMDAVKGSEMIFPVVFKTLPNQQYAPVREFRRRVRLALEQHHLLPGDPMRVFKPGDANVAPASSAAREEAQGAVDPTAIKPQSDNPLSGE